jgi:hypothetical protein
VTKSTLNQSECTRIFLEAAGIDNSSNVIDIGRFWWNPTNPNHLRLNSVGLTFIKKQTKLPIYTINVSHPLLSTHLIKLARINLGPYYLQTKTTGAVIMVINQEVATMLTLHAGNLGGYLENLQL